ncbi:MAG: D-alanine--D-alanine ligase [Endomicrobiales bacterium]|jgi:D-alanine-D-alanine ligase
MEIRDWLKKNRIGVLFGGQSAERAISLKSGQAVLKALRDAGANVVGIDAGPDVAFHIRKKRITFAYITLHGPLGEDGTMQGLLEVMGIPYCGCGVLASAVAMDKIATKRMLDSEKLPTPRWQSLTRNEPLKTLFRPSRSHKIVVKPVSQGSAIGVSIVDSKKDLYKAIALASRFDSRVLIEEYIAGTEITVGILGDRALPVVEIVPQGKFYDFDSKYRPGQSTHLIPPRLPKPVIHRVEKLALSVFQVLGCRAMARIDMIVDAQHRPWILEANTLPGMTETSLYPDAARAAGISFSDLVLKVIDYSK